MPRIYIELYKDIIDFLPTLISGVLSSIPFFIIWKISKSIMAKIIKQNQDHSKISAILLIGRTINAIIFIFAILTILGTIGIDVRALVAGLGLTGFALGFALKDVLSNMLAGIIIIFYRPLAINSHVNVLGVSGKVVNIDMRYTTVQDGNEKHLIPNAKLISEKITILS